MFAPVAMGVVKLEGSSDVKMVAFESVMRYLLLSLATRASLKPRKRDQYTPVDIRILDVPLVLVPLPTMIRLFHSS